MTDQESRPEQGPKPSSARLPSARERSEGGSEPAARRDRGRGRRGGKSKRERSSKPASAREMAAAAAPPAAEADTPVETLDVAGESWTVRILGRGGGSSRRASPPLLLLGFWTEGSPEGSGHAREVFVVGRGLSALSPGELEAAFARSTPPPERSAEGDAGRLGGRSRRR